MVPKAAAKKPAAKKPAAKKPAVVQQGPIGQKGVATNRTVSSPTPAQQAKNANKNLIKVAKQIRGDEDATKARIKQAQDSLVKAVKKSFTAVADTLKVQKKATDKLTAKIIGAQVPLGKKQSLGDGRTVTLKFTKIPPGTSVGVSGDKNPGAVAAMQNMRNMVQKK